jgi:hypothetical protein
MHFQVLVDLEKFVPEKKSESRFRIAPFQPSSKEVFPWFEEIKRQILHRAFLGIFVSRIEFKGHRWWAA